MSTPASDAFSSELDYLWDAVKTAQDGEARAASERARASEGLRHAASRIAHLETELARGQERERRLRAEIESFRGEASARAAELDRAAKQAEQLHAAADLRASFEKRLLKKDSEAALLDAEVSRLQAEVGTLREALKGREAAVEALKRQLDSFKALPEIAAAVAGDSRVSGQPESVYAHLLGRLDKEKAAAERAEKTLATAERELAAARAAAAESARETEELKISLEARLRELEGLKAELKAAADAAAVTAAERNALETRAAEIKAALGERGTALERAAAESAALRRDLDAAKAETARVRDEAAAMALKAEEHKGNFTGAVAQVFDLQKRAAALRSELTAERERTADLNEALAARSADLEKINGLLREAKTGLAAKVASLEAEIVDLRNKVAAANDYSAKLLRAVQERDLAIGALKADLRKTEALEMENEDLRRRNVKFSGLLRREQSDFTARVISALEKAAKDLKSFNLRIPAAERKGLEPALKNLLSSVNLMKGWQEYMDPETPELADTDLSGFFSGEAGKWERAFKQRKLSISFAVATPRLRARLHAEGMKMLFYHLVKNAYERLPSGGSLRVTLKGSEDGRQAVLGFEDTGPGFTQEVLGRLFAPFNTAEKGRAGIGLAVCARIAEKHGGALTAANRKDRGALVEVRLPLGGELKA